MWFVIEAVPMVLAAVGIVATNIRVSILLLTSTFLPAFQSISQSFFFIIRSAVQLNIASVVVDMVC
jgi:hypothetical protein